MNKTEALEQYETHFDEPLFNNYLSGLSDQEVVERVEMCLKEDKTYVEILQDRYGEDADL